MATIMLPAYNDRVKQQDYETAKGVLVGIADACTAGYYTKGHRNDIAVDLGIACYCLDIDSSAVMAELDLDNNQKNNLMARLKVVNDYVGEWCSKTESAGRSIWDYALQQSCWEDFEQNTEHHSICLA